MVQQLLLSLLKAGGIAALAIGVFYLLYREIIKLGIFPKLTQRQAFALLCLLALLVFVIAITAMREGGVPEKAPGQAETPPRESDLVAWWSGDTADAQGDRIRGTIVGQVTYTNGIGGRAFGFDGSGYIQASADLLPAGSDDRSIELWLMPTSLPNGPNDQETLFSYGAFASPNQEYRIFYSPSEFGIAMTNWGHSVGAAGQLALNQWHQVVVSSYAGHTSFFLDGQQTGMADLTIATPRASVLYIGGTSPENIERGKQTPPSVSVVSFHGRIQDVRIYGVALTSENVRALFNQVKRKHPEAFPVQN